MWNSFYKSKTAEKIASVVKWIILWWLIIMGIAVIDGAIAGFTNGQHLLMESKIYIALSTVITYLFYRRSKKSKKEK